MRVDLVQRVVCDYRVSFFNDVHSLLQDIGIEFRVHGGSALPAEKLVDALDELSFAQRHENVYFGSQAHWMRGLLEDVRGADLVVIEQAGSALHVYPLLLITRLPSARRTRTKVAFWGHGANLNQSKQTRIRDAWKRFLLTKVGWWFAYTDVSAQIVRNAGFPESRTTIVNNTIDSQMIQKQRLSISDEEIAALYKSLFPDAKCEWKHNKMPTLRVGVFCGRLTPLKWMPFLVESLDYVRERIPQFHAIILGDGPDKDTVARFCRDREWCVWIGAKHGPERVKYLALGDIWLNPGMTGLAIVDALSLGIPFATTDNGIHSPEISYLQDGGNGLLSEPDVRRYGDAVVALLNDEQRLQQFRTKALETSKGLTTGNMAKRFVSGVCACLGVG